MPRARAARQRHGSVAIQRTTMRGGAANATAGYALRAEGRIRVGCVEIDPLSSTNGYREKRLFVRLPAPVPKFTQR